ncbi:MAG: aldo/keto reductase [Candidatus Eisenbacteria bacterium]|nr:aldo/keto reductase [Candidatus Eisenbacteria bacterium]
MLYRRMDSTGDELSVLGFGCMRLPQRSGRIDEERATRQLHHAIDRGVNYVDTAVPYHMGTSEPFVGRALGDGYRERVKLATKLPPWKTGTREDMDRILDGQLERLRTDRVDYYLVHALNGKSWAKMRDLGVTDFLEAARADGRVVNAGFSFHGSLPEFKEIVEAWDWSFCQIQYNYLDERFQAGTEGLEYAAAKGLGVIAMEGLRGGLLGANVPPEVGSIWDEAEVRRTPAEWALRWVWNRPEIQVNLSGMNDEKHIEENLRIADEAHPDSLTDAELSLVRRAAEAYRGLMKSDCTGCRYCLPCPEGVAIPDCLQALNNRHALSDRRAGVNYAITTGGVLGGKPALASLCTECGTCLPRCPQNVPIPGLLKDVASEFEGPLFPVKVWFMKRAVAFMRWRARRGQAPD